ncbi:glycosyltransferase family 39 protein [Natronomonas amylolytica]|uniref:glycosyltransferase family 39 protein n=1 Tax=Natronomonas amylolytica TaxID=3108498 RepID=UPI003009C3E2
MSRKTAAIGEGLVVFLVAFAIRVVGAAITTVTTLNPDSTADAVGFARAAETIAAGLMRGGLVAPGQGYIYDLWGAFLAPFWLLPGPSGFYARLGNAFLGAIAVYNVYCIARAYHSRQAGVLAALPLLLYPSVVAIHSTVLRETIVLFAITTATRLLIVQRRRLPVLSTYTVVAALLYIAYIMRPENAVIYAVAIGTGLLVHGTERSSPTVWPALVTAGITVIGVAIVTGFVREGIDYLARIRNIRAGGRTVYLPEVIPQTLIELLAFSWVGAAYFLYAPFPWMIETIPDLLVGMEGIISIGFTLASPWGIRSMAKQNRPATVGLLVGLLLGIVLYGVGTVNYGTGMRHRQMFIWVIFIFGAVGITEHVRFVWGSRRYFD